MDPYSGSRRIERARRAIENEVIEVFGDNYKVSFNEASAALTGSHRFEQVAVHDPRSRLENRPEACKAALFVRNPLCSEKDRQCRVFRIIEQCATPASFGQE